MSEKAEGQAGEQQRAGDPVALANALRFEQAKNKVLLDEVIALEDEMVNRCMADFEGVVSPETRDFWREQLLSNRGAAAAALNELAQAKQVMSGQPGRGAGGEAGAQTRRPLHNRATARPAMRQGLVAQGAPVPAGAGGGAAGAGDDRAAKIRNRAHEISKAERIPFSAAFRRAEKEIADR